MPVTCNIAPHAARSINNETTALNLLRMAAPDTVSSSFEPGNAFTAASSWTSEQRHGLADTLLSAYNQHHALVLRPDDIRLAIIVLFSFYVNKYAEELRSRFVAHTGNETINVSLTAHKMLAAAGSWAR
ncbi:hypothetical protein BKA62DRAFT_766589 [Auriculariales sp. MPI-PUGE-AT-0066]|nr:hypothetical protein BKA62DRAFT_766589 [Auriculariales sp. MPI-PUGE-AT-0066]